MRCRTMSQDVARLIRMSVLDCWLNSIPFVCKQQKLGILEHRSLGPLTQYLKSFHTLLILTVDGIENLTNQGTEQIGKFQPKRGYVQPKN